MEKAAVVGVIKVAVVGVVAGGAVDRGHKLVPENAKKNCLSQKLGNTRKGGYGVLYLVTLITYLLHNT